MENNSYEFWQCTKCDEMNSADSPFCKKCGAPIPDLYKEDVTTEKEPKILKELQKSFYSKWITVGDIFIFCFVVNLIALIICAIMLFQR